ncbi:MAG: hypothetical protein JW808_01975 [Victivallales bacterium]|nr:hypothetical protein [Victivallales bacterium]
MNKFLYTHKVIAAGLAVTCLCSCDSLRRSNIEAYERELEVRSEKTDRKARESHLDDDDESLLSRDGLNPFEREVMDLEKKDYEDKARKRSQKIFGVFTPKDQK